MEPNRFYDFFHKQPKCRAIHKWLHYFDIYEKHFSKFKSTPPKILEIGIQHGGSIDMWNYYFQNKCEIIGVDIDTKCQSLKFGNNVKIVIGDQGSNAFWKDFLLQNGEFDIIIDDGGHTMKQQITTFEEIFKSLKDGGVYLCEDTHTSYWKSFGGGLKDPKSFVEYAKDLVDVLNMYHIREFAGENNKRSLREQLFCVSFYDSIIVFEKKVEKKPPTHQIAQPQTDLKKFDTHK
jgi:hypothetical protein